MAGYYGTDADDDVFNDTNFTLYGGDGNDQLGKNNADFEAYGGNGDDALYQDGNFALRAWGGAGNDLIVVAGRSSTASVLYGDDGNDYVIGAAANDYIEGGRDADALQGGAGNDTIYGGDGDESTAIQIVVGTGNAGFTFRVAAGIYGEGGNDYLDGGRGNDSLFGGANDDILVGGEGNDRLDGGSGTDKMSGGAGNDTYFVDSASDLVFEAGGNGSDTLVAARSYVLRAGQEIETLRTEDASATTAINLTGNAFNQTIQGNEGRNTLDGGDGADRLSGFGGIDTLNGGDGKDILTGGGGNDTFVFDTKLGSTNVDTITDFGRSSSNDDRFMLDNAVFTKLKAGTLSSDAFEANTTGNATDADHRIVYETDTGKLYYDADGSGSGAKVLFAVVTDHPTLTNADFLIV